MKSVRLLMLGLVLASIHCRLPTFRPAPSARRAISSGGEDEEINNAPAAYNTSIYLMAGMPYLLLGSVGFLIYRGCAPKECRTFAAKSGERTKSRHGRDE